MARCRRHPDPGRWRRERRGGSPGGQQGGRIPVPDRRGGRSSDRGRGVQNGAADYFALPEDLDLLRRSLEREAREARAGSRPGGSPRRERSAIGFEAILGRSAALRQTLDQAARVAVAPRRHRADRRRDRDRQGAAGAGHPLRRALAPREPFVEVNCAAIPANLLESELFGHERGAFTGADRGQARPLRAGARRHALPRRDRRAAARAAAQAAAGARGADDPAGRRAAGSAGGRPGDRARPTWISRPPARRGEFREDLYYRLNVVALTLPPLRERDGDIELLAETFLARIATGLRASGARARRRSLRPALRAYRVARQRARAAGTRWSGRWCFRPAAPCARRSSSRAGRRRVSARGADAAVPGHARRAGSRRRAGDAGAHRRQQERGCPAARDLATAAAAAARRRAGLMRRPHPGDCHAYRSRPAFLHAARPRRLAVWRAPTRRAARRRKPPERIERRPRRRRPARRCSTPRTASTPSGRGSRGPDLLPGRERRAGRGVPPPPGGRATRSRPCPTARRSPRAIGADHVRVVDPAEMLFELEPCGLTFNPAAPARAQDPLRPRRRRPQR